MLRSSFTTKEIGFASPTAQGLRETNGTDAGPPAGGIAFRGDVAAPLPSEGGRRGGDVGPTPPAGGGGMLPWGSAPREQPRRDQEDWGRAPRDDALRGHLATTAGRAAPTPNWPAYERILRKEKLELYKVALVPSAMPSRSSTPPPLVGDQWGGSRGAFRDAPPPPTAGGGVNEGGVSVSQTPLPTGGAATAKKIKYSINSYLLNVVSKFPRKYAYHFLGKEKLRKYYTMPFRLSMSRFLANRLARSYYMCISAKALEKMAKHAPPWGPPCGARGAPRGRMGGHNMNEKAKNFLLRLERRLDVSLLRLLNLKPTYIRKRMTPWHKQRWRAPASAFGGHPKQKYRLNSPISKYTSLQIKQLISRGSVRVNDKKVTTASRMIKVGDRVKVTGFMGSAGDIDQEAAPLALTVPRSIPPVGHKANNAPHKGGPRVEWPRASRGDSEAAPHGGPPPQGAPTRGGPALRAGTATWGIANARTHAPWGPQAMSQRDARPLSPPSAGNVPPAGWPAVPPRSGGTVGPCPPHGPTPLGVGPTGGVGARAITE